MVKRKARGKIKEEDISYEYVCESIKNLYY